MSSLIFPFAYRQVSPQKKLYHLNFALLVYVALLVLTFARLANDSVVYALLAKHMVLHGDWLSLVYQGADWLDKPHFPFWMMALSFEIFGLSARSYALPGLCFFALGAWFTWKLARDLYDESTATLSSIVYMSVLGSLLAVADQKAEVYLMGLLPTASYAWLRFVRRSHPRDFLKYGTIACICSACACMTKGIFVFFVLGIGVFFQLVYEKKWHQIWHWQWLMAALVCLILLTPELWALHQQFNSTSGIKTSHHTYASSLFFFFWDSQFGRFLNTGPIQNQRGSPVFFLSNIVWTFLPWGLILFLSFFDSIRKNQKTNLGSDIFIWTTFWGTFIVFSATKYQMDYYLFILFPYAAIGCASWLTKKYKTIPRWIVRVQFSFAFGLILLATTFTATHFKQTLAPYGIVWLAPLLAVSWIYQNKDKTASMLVLSIASVFSLFAFIIQFHADLHTQYDLGESAAHYTNQLEPHTIYIFDGQLDTFDFASHFPVLPIARLSIDFKNSTTPIEPFYVLVSADNQPSFIQYLAGIGLPMNRLQLESLRSFTEVELPSHFMGQLLKDDALLVHRNLILLRISSTTDSK